MANDPGLVVIEFFILFFISGQFKLAITLSTC